MKKKVICISLCFPFYYNCQRLKEEKNLDQLVCGQDRSASIMSCEWWRMSYSYIRDFMTILLNSVEEWALKWQGKVAQECFLFVMWTSPLPTHTVMNLPSCKRLLLSEMVLSLSEGPSEESAALLNPQWRLPRLLYLIPFSLIAGALRKGVCHWQSIGASLPWHCLLQQPLRPSSAESCMLYYFHAGITSSQLTYFFLNK